ncbi:hypothetical protein LPJ57_004932 [Coemansia sp. RSA 486]|nr:hypothetical protein LPJ57_004932 [Coemansia sp. RSA 486]
MAALCMSQATDLTEPETIINGKKATKTVTNTKTKLNKCTDGSVSCASGYYMVCMNGEWSDSIEMKSGESCDIIRSSINTASSTTTKSLGVVAGGCIAIVLLQLI